MSMATSSSNKASTSKNQIPSSTSSSSDADASAAASPSSAKGFLAGVASGLVKCSVGHPFDSVKIRMQCSPPGTYKSATDALLQLVRKEGAMALYKGVTPPAVGWMFTDAILLGSLHNYRLFLSRLSNTGEGTGKPLPVLFHGVSGCMAGITNSFFTAPVELIKAKLQMQHGRINLPFGGRSLKGSEQAVAKEFKGPIDCIGQIVRLNGIKGLWSCLPSTMLFRLSFGPMFAIYDILGKNFAKLKGTRYEMSPAVSTFIAGGISSEMFWMIGLPADRIKNIMMTDDLHKPKYPTIRKATIAIWQQAGPKATTFSRLRGFYVGAVPTLLRAFPTNASSLLAFETAMRLMGAQKTTQH